MILRLRILCIHALRASEIFNPHLVCWMPTGHFCLLSNLLLVWRIILCLLIVWRIILWYRLQSYWEKEGESSNKSMNTKDFMLPARLNSLTRFMMFHDSIHDVYRYLKTPWRNFMQNFLDLEWLWWPIVWYWRDKWWKRKVLLVLRGLSKLQTSIFAISLCLTPPGTALLVSHSNLHLWSILSDFSLSSN